MLAAVFEGVDGGGGGATVRAGGAGGTGGTVFAAPKATDGVGAKSRGEGGGAGLTGGAFLGGTSCFGFGSNCPTMSLPFAEALDRSRLGFTEGCIARSNSGKLGFEAD